VFFQYEPVDIGIDVQSMTAILVLLFLWVLFTYLVMKVRVFVILLPMYVLCTVLGIMAFTVQTILSPYLELTFVLYVNVMFFWACWKIFEKGEQYE
jgi:hypothetical protein